MKVGTLSLNINTPDFNYGAMLHSWAFQQWLLKQPYVEMTEVIDYVMPVVEEINRNFPLWSSLKGMHPRQALYDLRYAVPYQKRLRKFNNFVSEHFITSQIQYNQRTLNDVGLPYDTIICESDVIWSPGFSGGHFDKSFFMALDSMQSMKRIAYAPSMADGDLSMEQGKELRKLLKSVDYISCRETYAVDILKQYTDKKITHVIDPVLLLEENEYDDIVSDRLISDPYLLIYLPVNDNIKLRLQAKDYALKRGLKVLEISTTLRKDSDHTIVSYTTAGIEEFLSAIKHADVVFTNSFHAICFSIIFNKEFYAFSRAFNGKVRDICELFDLKRRFLVDDHFELQDPIDFEWTERIRLQEKEKSEEWISCALQETK